MKNIGLRFSKFRADWNNQVVGFVATLLGILIAFQLEDWKDDRRERGRLEQAVSSLKLETEGNKKLLEDGLKNLEYFNGYTDIIVNHKITDSTMTCSINEWARFKQNYPTIFSDQNIVTKIANDRLVISIFIKMEFFPTRIRTDNWEAIKYSGLLSSFPQEQLVLFVWLYNELSRDWTGSTPEDFYKYVNQHKEDFDLKHFKSITNNIENDYRFKLMKMDSVYYYIMKIK